MSDFTNVSRDNVVSHHINEYHNCIKANAHERNYCLKDRLLHAFRLLNGFTIQNRIMTTAAFATLLMQSNI